MSLDIKKFVSSYSLYNFHSHTQFCDGRDDMEVFVIEAIKQGFTDYGFSPHSPIPFDSPCNIKDADVAPYLAEFGRLKDKYKGSINLYASMEIDYIDENWGPSNVYFDTLPLDYRLGSVHFIPVNDGFVDIDGRYDTFKIKMAEFFNNDIRGVVESFYEQSIKMINAGGFDIIGHFDKIGHNAGHFHEGIETEDWYHALVMKTIEAIMDNHLVVEINTKAWEDHNRFFPNQRYFEVLKKYKTPLLINSDVHVPELVNSGREKASSLLQNIMLG